MTFITTAFSSFYKLFNQENIPAADWDQASFAQFTGSWEGSNYSASYGPLDTLNSESLNKQLMFSSSFLNFPSNPSPSQSYLSTRWVSASTQFKDQAGTQVSMSAIPWGSPASDLLWNIASPSWSKQSTPGFSSGSLTGTLITWTPTWTSKSFFSTHQNPNYGIGTSSFYPVTSSWQVFDPKYLPFQYLDSYPSELVGPPVSALRASSYKVHVDPVTGATGYDAGLTTSSIDSVSTVNDAPFDVGGGALITQAAVLESIQDQAAAGTAAAFDEALRKRRLYFPITYEGAKEQQGSDYWLRSMTGISSVDMFTESGGIYNLKFKLKRWNKAWVAEDESSPSGSAVNGMFDPAETDGTVIMNSGSFDASDATPADGSYMNIFIHDVITMAPNSSNRVAGTPGWYPLPNNIVTIGSGYNTTPVLTFEDAESGYREEQFDITLVQYGHPAQLCFEPSGSLSAQWGCIIDDIQICKVGVTSDARYTKQRTVAGRSNTIYDTLQTGK